ncbi:MAG: hypothetical protein K2J32_08940 [Ruminococcus sp.]|nr:hypothetical protein [Ruminococcus sp.]
MKRQKTKLTVSQEIKGFLKKYDYIISDDRLSEKAVGLMIRILVSLHYEVFTIEYLKELTSDNENDIKNELKELINVGYIKPIISPFNQSVYACNID